MVERRQHPRVGLSTHVWLGQDGIFTQSDERQSDLSVGGAFVELREQTYGLGNILTIRFTIASQIINSTVIVRYVRPGRGMGVEFLDLTDDTRAMIAAHVAEQATEPA